MSDERIVAKVVLCSAWGVDKTSIRKQYMGRSFEHSNTLPFGQDHLSTAGMDWSVKKVELDQSITMELQIWEIASQGFQLNRQRMFKGTSAAIMAFDLEKPKTFKELDSWFEQLWRGINEKSMPIVILGINSDPNNVKVTEKEVMEYIQKLKQENDIHEAKINYFTTSVKGGESINECLFSLAKSLFEELKD